MARHHQDSDETGPIEPPIWRQEEEHPPDPEPTWQNHGSGVKTAPVDPMYRKWWVWVLALVAFLVLVGAIFGHNDPVSCVTALGGRW